MGILEKVSARVDKITTAAEPGPVTDAPTEASDTAISTPATDELPDPAALEGAVDEVAPPAPDPAITQRTVLEEKLAAAREQRRASRARVEEARRAQAYREQAARDAQIARAERERWEKLREGSFKDGIQAMGRDPRKTFEEMQREAVEAGTPEGEIRRMRQEFTVELERTRAEMKEALEKELETERRRAQTEASNARFQADFSRTLATPGYEILREAYDDDVLHGYAQSLRSEPQKMMALAEQHGVRLTNPRRGFLMREILDVLKAVQADYDSQRSARRERLRGPKAAPKVNGTTGTKAPAGTIDNDLASARASNGSAKLSRADRIQAEIDRLEGR